MTVFIDTSAIYAYLDADDGNNAKAVKTMRGLIPGETLVTHNYVAVETSALVHRRLGAAAVRVLLDDVLPAFRTEWVMPEIHRAATSAFHGAARKRTSLVDWVSFEMMRTLGIRRAFAFDRDFAAAGFDLV